MIPHGARPAVERAAGLISLFHGATDRFAFLRDVAAADVPEPYRGLLDHRSHMTVAMERHYGGAVRLRVVAVAAGAAGVGPYAREIVLESPDGRVVQYGIVRIDLTAIDMETAASIRAARVPLGRLLIDAGLLRDVHDVSLLEVAPGPLLDARFGIPGGEEKTYGRVAEIALGGKPAVELLEICAPIRR